MTVLDARALNRAALARQHLLKRSDTSVSEAVAHLCGLQAQEPQEPFTGLWSRLSGFKPRQLDDALTGRVVVRTHLMRRTVHLVTADDVLTWRARHDTMLRRRVLGTYRRELAGIDGRGRRRRPRGHGRPAAPHHDGARTSSRRPLARPTTPCTGRAAHRSPHPHGPTPVPVRFLPAFDNAILGYHDRSRIIDAPHLGLSVAGHRTVLVDRHVTATWTVRDHQLHISSLRPLTALEQEAVYTEAQDLATFLDNDIAHIQLDTEN